MLPTGTVKWFDDAKGFGFIEQEFGDDVFVHYSEIEAEGYKTLDEDQEVEFELEETEKGLAATDVVPL
ncbi:MAG: cold-shock protein [bacterium]